MQLDAPFPLTPSSVKSTTEDRPALSPRRGSTVDRFGLEEPFGVYDRGRVEEAKRGRRCALPPHSIVGLNRSGLAQLLSPPVSDAIIFPGLPSFLAFLLVFSHSESVEES